MDGLTTKIAAIWANFRTKAGSLSDRGVSMIRRVATWSWDWSNLKGYQGNSLVYACVEALATAVPTAELEVRRQGRSGKTEAIEGHPLTELLRRPNPYLDQSELWHLTMIYYLVGGNAYWWKGRNGTGRVVELWPLRPDMIEPRQRPGSEEWIDYYEYNLDGRRIEIPPADLVHFRKGFDPQNPRKGLSPLAPILAEIGLDGMATEHVTALLDNYAIPGLAVKVKRKIATPAEADEIKARFMARYGGPKRGEPMIMDGDTEITGVNVTPQQMELPDLRRVAETRICAAFKVPAIIVGALAGLERSTFANYAEARESFWDEGVGPILQALRDKINASLLIDFDSAAVCEWYLGNVRALQEDEGAKYDRTLKAWLAGAITRNQWLKDNGYEETDDGEVYLIPNASTEREQGMVGLQARRDAAMALATARAAAVQSGPPDPLPGDNSQSNQQGTGKKLAAITPIRSKAAENAERIAGLSVRLRDQLAEGFTAQLDGYFDRLGKRAERRAKEKAGDLPNPNAGYFALGYAFTAEDLIQDKDFADLATIYGTQYTLVLELLWSEINGAIGDGSRFDVADPFVQEFASRGSARVTGIAESTRKELRAYIADAAKRGLSVDQMVGGVYDADTREVIVRPLREIVAETYKNRSKTIARTELGYAANAGAAARYKATGLVLAVKVYDGDDCGWRGHNDPDKAHHSIRTLDEAEAHTLAHPNCQRAFGPITEASELPAGWQERIA